jgi:CheY-like chemotaxis protein
LQHLLVQEKLDKFLQYCCHLYCFNAINAYPLAMKYKKSAFVVDDDPAFADSISLQLQRSGFDVKCFSSGMSAVRQLLCNSVNLVVLDYDLGEKRTGLQYLKTIRNATPRVPVLFLSEYDGLKTGRQALGFGASYYIEKNSTFMEKLPDAIDYLDIEKKGKFTNALIAFRKEVFSFYNF